MKKLSLISLLLLFAFSSCKQPPKPSMNGLFTIQENISTFANLVYKTVDSADLKLDVYIPSTKLGEEPWDILSAEKRPTLIYFHGGGWIEGERTSRFLGLLPYLEKGWCVVNVDYRLLDQTHLVGCLSDCLDAIDWTFAQSETYPFDTSRVYLSGESAGGHLALLTGMIDKQTQARIHPQSQHRPIAGIINWYGIADVAAGIAFWDDEGYTQLINEKWEGDPNDYHALVSPISYLSSDLPPILSIHGDADINVDVNQSRLLHEQLETLEVKNELIILPGKKHGNFSAEEYERVFQRIWGFTVETSGN